MENIVRVVHHLRDRMKSPVHPYYNNTHSYTIITIALGVF